MKDNWIKSHNLIIKILKEYELGDAYLILQGLDLVGYNHYSFWIDVVNYVKKYKGIESLVAYVDVMQIIGKDNLNIFLNKFINNSVNFQDNYQKFVELLTETKKHLEILNNNSKKL